jgi:hypothetical protein
MSLEKIEAREAEASATALALIASGFSPDVDVHLLARRLVHEVVGQEDPMRVDIDELVQAVGRAWMMGARVVLNTAEGHRTCRICGCWQEDACESSCSWVAPDLCSACLDPAELPGADAASQALPGLLPRSSTALVTEALQAILGALDAETARALARDTLRRMGGEGAL